MHSHEWISETRFFFCYEYVSSAFNRRHCCTTLANLRSFIDVSDLQYSNTDLYLYRYFSRRSSHICTHTFVHPFIVSRRGSVTISISDYHRHTLHSLNFLITAAIAACIRWTQAGTPTCLDRSKLGPVTLKSGYRGGKLLPQCVYCICSNRSS